jgi:hypothetical protein
MVTHDTLAFSTATRIVNDITQRNENWSAVFTGTAHATSSRAWPMPDFVIVDDSSQATLGTEFKPPDQTKREYLTGLGQAAAYTRDFTYAALIVPDLSNDGYRIVDHIDEVLDQDVMSSLPIALLAYDPKSDQEPGHTLRVVRRLRARGTPPRNQARLETSFWAKWRETSPNELGIFLNLLYLESVEPSGDRDTKPRDRAFNRFLAQVRAGEVMNNWAGTVRLIRRNELAWRKNYTNFLVHLGWIEPDGAITADGLKAVQLLHRYGAGSRVFVDLITQALLGRGKHLVLINEIERFQSRRFATIGPFENEQTWLIEIEDHLENEGLIKRNPERHNVNVQGSARQFLKAEKQLWKNLGLIVAREPSNRVYHPRKGFFFDWQRITTLLSSPI